MTKVYNVVKTEQVINKDVKNTAKEDLGKITEIMIDKVSGRVAYVVLESGAFLGMGENFSLYLGIQFDIMKVMTISF